MELPLIKSIVFVWTLEVFESKCANWVILTAMSVCNLETG